MNRVVATAPAAQAAAKEVQATPRTDKKPRRGTPPAIGPGARPLRCPVSSRTRESIAATPRSLQCIPSAVLATMGNSAPRRLQRGQRLEGGLADLEIGIGFAQRPHDVEVIGVAQQDEGA